MDTLDVYHVSTAVVGCALAVLGLGSIVAGGIRLIPALLAIGGVGMVSSAIYERFRVGPATDDPTRVQFWLVGLSAGLVLLSASLYVVF